MMAANVEEAAQESIAIANGNNGLAGNFGSDVLTGLCQLFGARDELPATAEHRCALAGGNLRVAIPRGRDGPGALQRRGSVVFRNQIAKMGHGWRGEQ